MSESDGLSGLPGFSPGNDPVWVRTGAGERYPVLVGAGGIDALPDLLSRRAPAHRYALIADANVDGLHGERVLGLLTSTGARAAHFGFPAGERHKSRKEWARLTDALLDWGMGRDGCVVALGGGVTGDLAGFVAATFMRGVPVVHVPTSLVAMIDSSVGGKTGVDVPAGKNLVGAFHPPRFVLADPDLACTLPREERAQGLVEAMKHGAIRDRDYLTGLEVAADALLDGDPDQTTAAVRRSVEIKAQVVSRDEREGGLRQILNFGHTLGHALEQCSQYRIPHGSAVAVGMVLEALLGEHLGVTEEGTSRELIRALERLELQVDPAGSLPTPVRTLLQNGTALVDATRMDKKARSGETRYVLLRRCGEADPGSGWSRPVPGESVRDLLLSICGL
jgi:3-dehydroquinate synthase